MTEDEAKQRWCPFAREVVIGFNERPASYNRFEGQPSERTLCIGSACMAWRWSNRMTGHDLEYMQREYGAVDGRARWEEFNRRYPLKGYCGLAGKQE